MPGLCMDYAMLILDVLPPVVSPVINWKATDVARRGPQTSQLPTNRHPSWPPLVVSVAPGDTRRPQARASRFLHGHSRKTLQAPWISWEDSCKPWVWFAWFHRSLADPKYEENGWKWLINWSNYQEKLVKMVDQLAKLCQTSRKIGENGWSTGIMLILLVYYSCQHYLRWFPGMLINQLADGVLTQWTRWLILGILWPDSKATNGSLCITQWLFHSCLVVT